MKVDRTSWRQWPLLMIVGFLLYAAFLLINAPASMLAWGLERASGKLAVLERPDGGLWRGHAAALVITVPGFPPQRFSDITWRLSGLRLFRGQLAVDLTVNGSAALGKATAIVQPRALRLSGVSVKAPMSSLSAFLPALQLAKPGGEFALSAEELVLGDRSINGKADIEWVNASSPLSPVSPLGTYRASVNGLGESAKFVISTVSGALQVEGSGAWSRASGLSFAGRARALPPEAASMQQLLGLLGPDDGAGARQLSYTYRP